MNKTFLIIVGLTSALCARSSNAQAIDATTINGKLLLGYQGWFACPGDGSQKGWTHWFNDAGSPTIDMLPDVHDLPKSARCQTNIRTTTGKTIELFSSQRDEVVDKHFQWMRDYSLDGIVLQRFGNQLSTNDATKRVDHVLSAVRSSSVKYGRVYFIMYDLTGMQDADLGNVAKDWRRLVADGVDYDSSYLHDKDHPLVGLWGLGFRNRRITSAGALHLIDAMQQTSSSHKGVEIVGGVAANWRSTEISDELNWRVVWSRLGVISPWTVGAFKTDKEADDYAASVMLADVAEARRLDIQYMPVVFPGFSWLNLKRASGFTDHSNAIPRRCGVFYQKQVKNALQNGATMIYNAMFDEVDEGTAMFKLAETTTVAPRSDGARFVPLNVDGCTLPSDWYLRLAGQATRKVEAQAREKAREVSSPGK